MSIWRVGKILIERADLNIKRQNKFACSASRCVRKLVWSSLQTAATLHTRSLYCSASKAYCTRLARPLSSCFERASELESQFVINAAVQQQSRPIGVRAGLSHLLLKEWLAKRTRAHLLWLASSRQLCATPADSLQRAGSARAAPPARQKGERTDIRPS